MDTPDYTKTERDEDRAFCIFQKVHENLRIRIYSNGRMAVENVILLNPQPVLYDGYVHRFVESYI